VTAHVDTSVVGCGCVGVGRVDTATLACELQNFLASTQHATMPTRMSHDSRLTCSLVLKSYAGVAVTLRIAFKKAVG
jgi:hypothetical protein